MSAIIIDLQPDRALIGTDTLIVSEYGTPIGFTSKAFLLPHINTVIAGTGIAGVSSSWFRYVNEVLRPTGIEGLHADTQVFLQMMFEGEFAPRWRWESMQSVTIYQIGRSEVDGTFKGFAYCSQEYFEPKPLKVGRITMKPDMGLVKDYPDTGEDYVNLIEAMKLQKANQDAMPQGEGLFIGGEICTIEMMPLGNIVRTIHRFDDYDQSLEASKDS
ncbi:hypothetical protein VPH49_25485 [Pseudomonas luteola]|uniref:hypothetical protein n=1 Tax=Pseudomonas luteola TaxID=47886 RepID=UPI0003624BBA|nr:hypothetical protein [Pseudomonas luteola]